jgi:hypothetical protein
MITNKALVKILADLYTRSETGAPTTASVGALGDIWLDNSSTSETYGNTYELTSITTGPTTYVWTLLTRDDARIDISIARAEKDYLAIRGTSFELSTDTVPVDVYPDGADSTAAEMVCYLCGYGVYQGRGEKSESLGDRSATHDDKIHGYPRSIVGTIKRYQAVI